MDGSHRWRLRSGPVCNWRFVAVPNQRGDHLVELRYAPVEIRIDTATAIASAIMNRMRILAPYRPEHSKTTPLMIATTKEAPDDGDQ